MLCLLSPLAPTLEARERYEEHSDVRLARMRTQPASLAHLLCEEEPPTYDEASARQWPRRLAVASFKTTRATRPNDHNRARMRAARTAQGNSAELR